MKEWKGTRSFRWVNGERPLATVDSLSYTLSNGKRDAAGQVHHGKVKPIYVKKIEKL